MYLVNEGNGKIIKMDISGVNYNALPATAPNNSDLSEITIPTAVPNLSTVGLDPQPY